MTRRLVLHLLLALGCAPGAPHPPADQGSEATTLRSVAPEQRLAYLREYAHSMQRSRALDIALVPFGLDMFARGPFDAGLLREGALELAELGVTWLTLSLPSRTRAEYQAEAERCGREVIAKLTRDEA